jgi:uncharacterized RDD family membrane protein YckC
LDLIIQAGLGLVLLIVAGVIAATGLGRLLPAGPIWVTALVLALVFALHYGYFIGFEILWGGQTPGKRKVGIRVVKDSGRPLTVFETIGRNLLRIVDALPGFYAVGIVTALLNSQNKRLGDFVAGSLVIREASLADLRPAWAGAQAAPAPSLLGAGRLSAEDLTLIDTFLARRSDLPDAVRSRMAAGILQRLQPKLSSSLDPALSAEAILERAAYESRSAGGYQ